MSGNEKFVISDDELSSAPEVKKAGPERKPCPKCGKSVLWLVDGSGPRAHNCTPTQAAPAVVAVAEPAPVEKFIDPEDDRKNWPTIHIEMETGKPNYETFITYGTRQDGSRFGHDLQVMRSVDVQVPPSVVNNLREAIATHHVPMIDPNTGKERLVPQERSSIPWRLVKGGKYIS